MRGTDYYQLVTACDRVHHSCSVSKSKLESLGNLMYDIHDQNKATSRIRISRMCFTVVHARAANLNHKLARALANARKALAAHS